MSVKGIPLLDRLICSSYFQSIDLSVCKGSINSLCRDLEVLFSSIGVGSACDLKYYPQISRSVLNYGIGNIAGTALTTMNIKRLRLGMCTIIQYFEPRIVAHNLDIQLLSGTVAYNQCQFLLKGEIRALNRLLPLQLLACWNTESGEVEVQAYGKHHE